MKPVQGILRVQLGQHDKKTLTFQLLYFNISLIFIFKNYKIFIENCWQSKSRMRLEIFLYVNINSACLVLDLRYRI